MSSSKKYFRLTSDILLEYNYSDLSEFNNQQGENQYIKDLWDDSSLASIVTSKYDNSISFFLNNDIENGHVVIPTNSSESKFINCIYKSDNSSNQYIWGNGNLNDNISSSQYLESNDEDKSDILFDKIRLHFTSRNFMGSYDGLIIKIQIYRKNKKKSNLLSYYIRRDDDLNINPTPLLINQKLYTTYLDFEIPSTNAIINSENTGEGYLNDLLSDGDGLMDNTPMIVSIYGIKATNEYNSFDVYITEKISDSVYMPICDSTSQIEIKIEEPEGCDYFEIYPNIKSGSQSFSDYISEISDDRPDAYIVFYDLSLIEHYTDSNDNTQHKETHREQYIINAAQDNDGIMEIDEDALDDHMLYRPVLKYSSRIVSFTIDVQMKILNTIDNTTIVKSASKDYGLPNSESENEENPKKYGKKMIKINLGSVPAQINVYNKKPDGDTDNVKLTNSTSSAKIENHQHTVTGFIECANIGVTIEQIPLEQLNN